ncbi:MAG: S-layer homology domain-containing protein [Eubacteriales bacterium]
MKKVYQTAALVLAALTLSSVGVSAETILRDGVEYESHKTDDLRLVRYPADRTDTEYTVEEGSSIMESAFEGAEFLERVTIPYSVFFVGDYAFRNCTALREVIVGENSSVSCGYNAFEGCTSLDPAFIEEFCWDNPFTDVFPQDPYYNAVKFVHKAGVMNGMSDGQFSPHTSMTRAMFVTVLGRLAGAADGTADQTFTDVEENQWYTDYVYWAAANGIVEGYGDGTFGVNDKVTIEQAAVILARYAGVTEAPACDMEGVFSDADDLSDWAVPAMRWITAENIYQGYNEELRPKQNAPRALAAQMLYNCAKANAMTAAESAAHLKETLKLAYETQYGTAFVPTDEEEPAETYGEVWDRYHISLLDESSVISETERYCIIPYVWDFYIDKYTGAVYVYYNGLDPFLLPYDPTVSGLAFAG